MTNVGIYPRRSLDRSGQGKGVKIQIAEASDYLQEQPGWTLRGVYGENGAVSASRYATADRQLRDRPAYRRLVGDVEAGHVDVILLTEVSRLDRDVGSVLDLVAVADRRRFTVATTDGHRFELGTAQGNHAFIEAVNDGQFESARLSERVRRTKRTRAREGAWPGGRRPIGYRVEGTPVLVDGKAVLKNCRLEPEPIEAEAIRAAAARIMSGGSLSGAARDWLDRDLRGPNGRRLDIADVQRVLRSPRTAGLVRLPDGTFTRAQWEPIIQPAEWEQLNAVLDGRPVKRGPSEPRRHLLTGLLRCAVCAPTDRPGVMSGTRINRQHPAYQCGPAPARGCSFRIHGRQVDDGVRDAVLTALASAEFRGVLQAAAEQSSPDGSRAAALVAQRAALDARLQELREKLGTILKPEDFAVARDVIEAEQVKVTAELAALNDTRAALLAELPHDFDTLLHEWKERWDLDRRRTVLKAALRGVLISRPGGRGKRFDPERDLDFDWRV